MKIFEKNLLLVVFIISLLAKSISANWNPFLTITNIVLIFAVIMYLFVGWYMLYPDKGKVFHALPFFASYFVAQGIMSRLFGLNEWPFRDIFLGFTLITNVIALVATILYQKTIDREYPKNEFLSRIFIALMIAAMVAI
jgi:hypothetical protein